MQRFCTGCGARRDNAAKFCTGCGAAFAEAAQPASVANTPSAPPPAPPPPPPPPPPLPPAPMVALPVEDAWEASGEDDWQDATRRRPLLLAAAAGVALIAASGGWAYWQGYVGDRPGSVARSLDDQLAAAGYENVEVAMDGRWIAALSGMVTGSEAHDRAIAMVRNDSDVLDIEDKIIVLPSLVEQIAQLNKQLVDSGFSYIQVLPSTNGTITLTGAIPSRLDNVRLLALIGERQRAGLVEDRTVRSPEWIASDIREALTARGYGAVQVSVGPDNAAVLTGTVSDPRVVATLPDIARQLGASTVRNEVVYVPPGQPSATPSAASSAYAPATAPAPRSESSTGVPRGTWRAMVHNGLLDYVAILDIRGGSVGGSIGQSAYGTASGNGQAKIQCRFDLVLTSSSASQLDIEEVGSSSSLFCPGNKRIRLTHAGRGSVHAQWFRKKSLCSCLSLR